MLKKVLLIFIIIVSTILLLIIGIFWVRNYRSYQVEIPRSARHIIKVDIDGLLQKTAKSYILESLSFRRDSSRIRKPFKLSEPWDIGVYIPSNVFFYSNEKGETPKTIFSRFEVRSLSKLKEYLRNTTDTLEIIPIGEDLFYTQLAKGHMQLLFDNHSLLLSLSTLSDPVTRDSLRAIFSSPADTFQKLSPATVQNLKTQKGDIVYSEVESNKNFKINFERGHISGEGTLEKGEELLTDLYSNPQLPNDLVMGFWWHGEIPAFIKEAVLNRLGTETPIDTLYKYYGGYMEAQWFANSILQSDTIINYDYDENFEIKEVEQVIETKVPNLQLLIKASPHLLSFVPEKMYYKFQRYRVRDSLYFSTDSDRFSSTSYALPRVSSPRLGHIFLDIERLSLQDIPFDLPPYLVPIKSMDIDITQDKNHKKWKLNIDFADPDTFSLLQWDRPSKLPDPVL